MKTYTLKAVLLFTALTFVFPLFILAVAKLAGSRDGDAMMLPFCATSFLFLTFFYTRYFVGRFKLPESIVFGFILAGIVVAFLLKVCLFSVELLGAL